MDVINEQKTGIHGGFFSATVWAFNGSNNQQLIDVWKQYQYWLSMIDDGLFNHITISLTISI